jgi:hypothetical protein
MICSWDGVGGKVVCIQLDVALAGQVEKRGFADAAIQMGMELHLGHSPKHLYIVMDVILCC